MLEKLKSTLDKGVAAVTAKSESIVEGGRTKVAISNVQRRMNEELADLGSKVYTAWKGGQFSIDQVTEELNRVKDSEAEIASLNEYLEQLKAEEDRVLGAEQTAAPAGGSFCSNCGKALSEGSRFCDGCGTPVNQG